MSQSLRKLTLNEVNWYKPGHAIKFKLSDGQTCKAGDYKCWNSHIFDPAKKITRIECALIRLMIVLNVLIGVIGLVVLIVV